MTREEVGKFVSSRSWYQTIEFEEGIKAKGCLWCGDPAWGNMIKFLPKRLDGMRVLDLGCNAGLFCVRSAMMGAKEVVGVDYTEWRPKWDFEEQQVFVQKYFEQKNNTTFPIQYVSAKMEDFLEMEEVGQFDYVYGIASLYYTETPDRVVERISQITNKAIIRLRDANRIAQFTSMFKHHGFEEAEVLREKWWEKLDRQTDDFYMYLYVKE
ncbi:hypothetical protein DRO66_06815 [Candidatus Bathyarchaeota archaeon]|nr:MAG: hypothetical protein DRO66_06815 [Candidatus Bathyarchaeota archaeon]